MSDDPAFDPTKHVRDGTNRESAESMLAALRAVLDHPTLASGLLRADGTPDEEMITWTRAIIPWVGRSISTRSHCEVLEITRVHGDHPPELRFGGYRLNKNRRAAQGVYEAISGATKPW